MTSGARRSMWACGVPCGRATRGGDDGQGSVTGSPRDRRRRKSLGTALDRGAVVSFNDNRAGPARRYAEFVSIFGIDVIVQTSATDLHSRIRLAATATAYRPSRR